MLREGYFFPFDNLNILLFLLLRKEKCSNFPCFQVQSFFATKNYKKDPLCLAFVFLTSHNISQIPLTRCIPFINLNFSCF